LAGGTGFQVRDESTADNGVVYQIVNGLDGNRTQNFQYDNLNRIKQANTTGSNWGETYTVDAWGNLTGRGPVSGKNTYEPLSASVNTNNQVIGLGYDIAGNLTSNGSATYIYDARNQLINTGGYTYGYDANGERVKKMGGANPPGAVYLHGPGGETLTETNGSGTLLNEYILLNGQRIARRDANGAVHYYFADHLGSASVITDASGTVQKEADYFPYGGEIAISGADPNHYKFTGKERDETGLDEFGARYYSSAMGRFMTADWGAIPMAVPYAVLGNPQTLNLYSYVENNPATGTDPDGHCCDWQYVEGAVQAWASDTFAAGTFHGDSDNPSFQAGQIAGDRAALAQGAGETVAGQSGVGGGAALTLTGVGAPVGGMVVTGSAILEGHGAVAATAASVHLLAETPSGPKAADAPGVTAGGQAIDKYGNKVGPSGRQQVNEVDHSTEKGAKDAARQEGKGAPEKHPSPTKGDPHYHPTDKQGEKVPNSTHHNYPD
jgi:RHS repeat-associated protein